MKHPLLLLLFLLTTLTSWAGPARRGTFSATMPDGSVVTLELMGDEHLHYYRNVATGQTFTMEADGTFVLLDDASLAARRSVAEERRAAANARRMARLAQRSTPKTSGPNRVGVMKPASGKKKGLVILVNFSDNTFDSKYTRSFFERMFNEEGFADYNHVGSVHDYFKDQSYGKLDLTFDVVGPVTVSQTMSYYGQNDSDGDDLYPGKMVIEACRLADKAGTDFSQYDWDGDGEVEQVFVIYAGYGEAQGAPASTIWPHEWTLTEASTYGDGGGYLRIDGVKIDTYACSCELRGKSGSNISPIGSACHEFSHCLGLPDFYDTSGSRTSAYGMGYFDLMDHGSYNGPSGYGEVPSGYTAYERWMAGWLTPIELKEPTTVRSMPDLGQHPAAYVVYNSGTANEYLLLENRRAARWFSYFDDSLPNGHGLFVTHVDYSSSVWEDNEVNALLLHQRMSPVPASGFFGTTVTAGQRMFFPAGATVLDESSHTNSGGQWFNTSKNGTRKLGHVISDIALSGDSIAFKFDGGAPEDDGSRFTLTFDAGTGFCSTSGWTQTTFRQTCKLPSATPPAEGLTFAGWATSAAYGAKPSVLLAAGTDYRPEADATLYAVYAETVSATPQAGSYVLDYNAEAELQARAMGYGAPFSYTAADGGEWVIKAFKNAGLQINTGKDASIKVPDCPGAITTINIECSTKKAAISLAATDYTGGTAPSAIVTGTAAKSQTLTLSGRDVRGGYLYTTSGNATAITRIEVHYAVGTNYYTYPETSALAVPVVTLPATTLTLQLGDAPRTFAASVTGTTAAVVYTSSDPTVATISAEGLLTPLALGTTTITAAVPAVAGESRAAQTTATVNVVMPTLQSISIAQPPTKTTYAEGETFNPAGLVLTATYANGLTKSILPGAAGLTLKPATALTAADEFITLTYTEGAVTLSATIAISVVERPRFTVKLDAAGGSCSAAQLTEAAADEGVVLPEATTAADDWTFCGWSTTPLYVEASESPELLTAGTNYKPTSDVTLHAVYRHSETTAEGSGLYERVTAAPKDWSGQYLIVMRNGNEALVADGSKGGKDGIGAVNSGIVPAKAGYDATADAYDPTAADAYSVHFIAADKGYLLQTADGLYNSSATSGTSSGVYTAQQASAAVPLTLVFRSADDVRITYVSPSAGTTLFVFAYNLDASKSTYFRFYSSSTASGYINDGRTSILYRKAEGATLTTYSSYPVATIVTLVKAIGALHTGNVSLDEIEAIGRRILQRK